MKKTFNKTSLVNIFGAMGYVALVVVWVFALAVIATLLAGLSLVTDSTSVDAHRAVPSIGHSSLVLVVATYAITALVSAIAVAMLVALPYLIGKWMSRFLYWVLKITKLPISLQVVFFTKGLLMVLPLIALMVAYYLNAPIDMTLAAMFVATVALAVGGLIAFLIQWWLAVRRNLDTKKIW